MTETHPDTGGGNTSTPPEVRSRMWFFTLNNYETQEITMLLEYFSQAEKYRFQEEMGESGTPHLQGNVYFKNAKTLTQIKQLNNRIHWEKTRNPKKAFAYCGKTETRNGKTWEKGLPKKIKDPLEGKILKDWQQEIMDIIKTEPDERTVYWYWEENGKVGKSALVKHLCLEKQAMLITGGSKRDMLYQISEREEPPEIIVINIPRSTRGIDLSGIEEMKDGAFSSSKYKSGMYLMNPPHIFIFANYEPELDFLSVDKWVIKKITN